MNGIDLIKSDVEDIRNCCINNRITVNKTLEAINYYIHIINKRGNPTFLSRMIPGVKALSVYYAINDFEESLRMFKIDKELFDECHCAVMMLDK